LLPLLLHTEWTKSGTLTAYLKSGGTLSQHPGGPITKTLGPKSKSSKSSKSKPLPTSTPAPLAYFLRTRDGYLAMHEDADSGVLYAGGQPVFRLPNGQEGVAVVAGRTIPPTAYRRSDLEFTSETLQGTVCCRVKKDGPLAPLPEYTGSSRITLSDLTRTMARREGKLRIRGAKAEVKQAQSQEAPSLKTLFELKTWISNMEAHRKQAKAERPCDVPGCPRPGIKTCSRCRDAFYCSADCQRAAWSAHKAACTATSSNPLS
jgi:hypothetical protein